MDKKIMKIYDAGDHDRAIHLLIKKIDNEPKNVDNYLQLATFLIEQNSAQQALELLQKAQVVVDQPEKLSYDIAVCYYMLGEFEKSLKLIDSLPNDDETLYQKSLIFMKMGQYQKALAFALTIKKQDNKILELLGDIWLSLGELKAAHDSFAKVPEKQRSAKVNFLLGLTIFDKDQKQAEQFFSEAKKLDKNYVAQAEKQYSAIAKLIRGKDGSN
ncbi:tetratricopeptide repeat protein [Lactobacillus hominis]|uniref:tetratricopeptide repeat protein n=1 Tax=Lactobacillus hominis TaxID=1203033 RepID=UPI0023F1BE25|nr:tetratricopeptide repeat protein [Lactobacillus hominis]